MSIPIISLAETNPLIVPQEPCKLADLLEKNVDQAAESHPSEKNDTITDSSEAQTPAPTTQLLQQVTYCTQQAVNGDLEAQFQLGQYYEKTDAAQAVHWYEQASLQGHAAAQWRLGLMFFEGKGTASNKVQSFIILKMASINGEEQAIDAADKVAYSMHSQELELANQMLSQIFYNYMQELMQEPELAPTQRLSPSTL